MNENHARVCPSPEWADHIQNEVLPSLTADVHLGEHLLEIGPGPGAATDWLRHKVKRLTALEVDPEAAALLSKRFAGTNVEVVTGDATEPGYPDGTFDSVGCFTMLHHIPTLAEQHKLLTESFRVLKPGGVFIASDSLASNDLHQFHVDDTYNPIDPASALIQLRLIGFSEVTVMVSWMLRFIARKPADPAAT